ncbi:MAG TPA: hypothetical protein VNI83_07750 [Vicinamibacterales bacterium]|nr:hypothetical protein [Vicinamibacterales bacterium]
MPAGRVLATAIVLLATAPAAAWARPQENRASAGAGSVPGAAQRDVAAPQEDVAANGAPARADREALPVSLDRIRRELAQPPRRRSSNGLRLDYYVEVYGRAPKFELFRDADLTRGAVPYGPPTHREVLEVITPPEYRTPAADIGSALAALVRWLSERSNR